MTISIKPTASGSTIEQDGSTILTVDGGGNISAANNFTATGHVLQVVSTTSSTNFTTTSQTLQDTGFSASITPSSSSSKILAIVNFNIYVAQNGQGASFVYCRGSLARESTQLQEARLAVNTGTTDVNDLGNHGTIVYLDSPATTSSITYKLFVSSLIYSFSTQFNWAAPSTFTLMEIAG